MRQLIILFITVIPAVLSWTPISNPMKTFSLTQTLPAFGASASSGSHLDQQLAQSIRSAPGPHTTSTFFGKKVLNLDDNSSQFGSSFDVSSSFSDDDLIKPTHGFFGEKIHNGFLSNVS